MDFRLTEEQELLLASVREMMQRDFPDEYFRKCDLDRRFPVEFMTAMAENGISLLGVPDEFDGVPADMLTQILIIEELARMGGTGYLLTNALCVHNMVSWGSRDQLEKTVESAQKGIPAYSLLFTEPQAGSDNNLLATTATRSNGKVYLNGQKTFITGARDFPYMLVLARDAEPKDPKRCFTMWWVDPQVPGVKIQDLVKIGWHQISNCEVYFDNVELEESAMVGKEGYGFIHLMKNFEIERLVIAAYACGMARCAYEDAVRYANQRQQFGQSIGQFQMIQEKIVDMAIQIENMHNFICKVAWQNDNSESLRISSALCKRFCAKAAGEVIDAAMQVMGGVGYTEDVRISRLWRDVRITRMAGGTDEVMVYIAARQILKEYEG
ncbi:Crotonobetainyl-CoA reductase [bioreactor metagenome]|uniref:Crotonobetainyl-CoA reductase n=1 Tax=bioreactor metagenome TaxID=1076179 RepID=A0A644SRI4_9ZZZZ|nr:acyl-CoA dehydrogenase [Desulfovibrio desulfuricans]MEA4989739.1 acyl-CoA dehydrogenase [Desulfovibrio desulfuricans]